MGNFFKKAALVAALSVVGVASFAAEGAVTSPTLETDVGAYITAAIALMGGVF